MADGTFSVIHAKRGGRDAIVVIDGGLDAEELSDRFPWLLTITLPIAAPNERGLCDDVESERLSDVEDGLLAALDRDAYAYVGRITWSGRREVLVYVADPAGASARIGGQARRVNQPVELDADHEPDWETYHRFVH
jgi:hypothetical protein